MNHVRRITLGEIFWMEDESSGRGYYRLRMDDGGGEEYQCDTPITARTDSHAVAALFDLDVQSIDHDGATIHVAVRH